jgi:hypothetical protein
MERDRQGDRPPAGVTERGARESDKCVRIPLWVTFRRHSEEPELKRHKFADSLAALR